MAQRILGLDLGATAVKAVLLESTYRGFAVVEHARAEVPPAGEGGPPLLDRQAAVLQNLVAARGWHPDETVAAFPGAAGSSHVVTLPFTDPRRIEQTVGFEVEDQIPFDLDDVAWDWQPLGTRDGKTDLFVGVVRKEELAAVLAALAAAGIDPRAVVPAAPAYAALAATGVLAPLPPGAVGQPAPVEAIVDVGAERTSICVIGPGGCEAARTFAFGAGHLARALARELGLAEPDAGLLLAAEGGGAPPPEALAAYAGDPRAAEALRRALAPLARELRATIRAWRARVGARAVARLSLAGDAARLPGLPDLLAAEVEGPVAPLALSGPAAEALGPAAPGLALPLALALRAHQGTRAPRLNLRRGALAFTRDFEHLKGKVARLGAYAALVLLLAVTSAGVKVFALSRQEALLDRSLCDAQQKILGKCYANFEEAQAILRGRGTPGASLPKVSAVEVLTELADRVPSDVKVRFDRIEVTRDKVHLEGATEAAENVDKIVSALRASRCFGDARSGSARKRASDGKFEFSVDSGLTCVEGGPQAAGGRG